MPDVSASPARVADGEVPDLAILRQIAEEDEVAEPTLKRLRVQLRVEDAHVETGGGCDVGDDDVQVIDLGRVDGQQIALLGPRRHRTENWNGRRRSQTGHEGAAR